MSWGLINDNSRPTIYRKTAIWIGITTLIILSLHLLWELYGLPSSKRWLAWLLGFSFIPVLQALDVG
jgi:hypothetical protein